MKYSDRTLLELVGLVYDAAADSAQWIPLLERLSQVLRMSHSALYVHDITHGHRSVTAEVGFDPAFLSSYKTYYAAKNAYVIHGKRHLWPGNVCMSEVLCPDPVLFKTEFYNDWLAPQGTHRSIEATIARHKTLASILVLVRKDNAKAPDEEDVSFVRALMPHFQRGLQFHHRITDMQTFQQTAKNALDGWSLGVIVLDRTGNCLFMNRAAEAIVRRGDGLALGTGGFRATFPHNTAKLKALIREAILTANRRGVHSGGSIMLARSHSERPLSVLVAPLSLRQTLVAEKGAACVLFVSDPDSKAEMDEDLLRRLYGLTLAESKIVGLLVDGHDVKRVCDELKISTNTARTHLRRVFEKTNTRRQAELLRLILMSPVSFRLKS